MTHPPGHRLFLNSSQDSSNPFRNTFFKTNYSSGAYLCCLVQASVCHRIAVSWEVPVANSWDCSGAQGSRVLESAWDLGFGRPPLLEGLTKKLFMGGPNGSFVPACVSELCRRSVPRLLLSTNRSERPTSQH